MGLLSVISVIDALNAILAGAVTGGEEEVPLADAHRRVLARNLAALRTQPPDAMSAMDGYAVRATDATLGAKLRIVGEVAAGRPFGRAIASGEAARIFTGGVLPDGANAVVIQEDTTRDGDRIIVNEAAVPNRHIRMAGVDFNAGDVLLNKGRRLSDRDLSLAASMNHPSLPVFRKPRIALLATGDELVMPGHVPGPGQIIYSNGYALHALMRGEGAETIDLGIAADTLASTKDGIRRAREAGVDVLVTTGGASVGDHDLVQAALTAEGTDMAFWKIAMRPGKPMMHGRLGGMRVVGLPGNPVSSYVCCLLFVVPLIRALAGRSDIHLIRQRARLGRDLAENDQREDYLRATLSRADNGDLIATPVSKQDSSLLGFLAGAQALLIRPPFASAAREGALCDILQLPDEPQTAV